MTSNNVEHENEDGGEMTTRQAKFCDCLLAGANLSTAAQTCKVSLATATRWHRLPSVKAQLRQARQEIFEDRLSILKEAVPIAIKTLLRHMTDKDTRPYVQVAAATAVLNLAVELYRSDLLEDRLGQLEERLKDAAR